uniref:protein FAR1-RELATED SEQUENCE 12-like n=1 Tax=Erigeron canadensis TaxID=72917 RepID=UPI001CB90B71|nr:protein FAR1-RELATED SEQUENCE 12-like [Erigeron canadensis]
MDVEVHLENPPLESHLIDEIDANGCLIGSENESEGGEDIEVDIGSENDEDHSVHVNHEITRDKGDDVKGKVFETAGEAYEFYNRYALLHGFGIRIYSTYKNKITNEEYRKKYVCNKQDFKDLKRNTSGGMGFKDLKGNPKK